MYRLIFRLLVTALALLSALVLWQQGQLQVLALQRIDPLPQTHALLAEKRYAEAAEYLGFFMEHDYVQHDPQAQALWQQIDTERRAWHYQAGKVWQGMIEGSSDETAGQVASVLSDLMVIGDLRDLAVQASRYLRDEETDPVIVALSALGVAATGAQLLSGAGTVASAGAASPALAGSTAAKQGIVTLKALRRADSLPPWLGATLVRASRNAASSRNLDEVGEIFQSVQTLGKTPGGLRLLRHSTDAASLHRMARFADHFAPHGATLYRIGGDTALQAGTQLHRLDKSSIQLAATYGQRGLRVLDDMGTLRFVKYSARASKIVWKGDLQQLLSRLLLQLPRWALLALIALGILVWWPTRRRKNPPAARQEPSL